MAETWKPPTEEEFNHNWLRPSRALEIVNPVYEDESTTKRWLMARLKSGVIIAAARTVHYEGGRLEFAAIPARLWEQSDEWGDDHFWATGDDVFNEKGTRLRMLDIRLDPQTLGSRAKMADPPDSTSGLRSRKKAKPSGDDKWESLSSSDADKFCRFLLDIRPNATEREAHRRAVDFFHDRKVPRDWFWEIFRAIRGHRNPGKRPKDRN